MAEDDVEFFMDDADAMQVDQSGNGNGNGNGALIALSTAGAVGQPTMGFSSFLSASVLKKVALSALQADQKTRRRVQASMTAKDIAAAQRFVSKAGTIIHAEIVDFSERMYDDKPTGDIDTKWVFCGPEDAGAVPWAPGQPFNMPINWDVSGGISDEKIPDGDSGAKTMNAELYHNGKISLEYTQMMCFQMLYEIANEAATIRGASATALDPQALNRVPKLLQDSPIFNNASIVGADLKKACVLSVMPTGFRVPVFDGTKAPHIARGGRYRGASKPYHIRQDEAQFHMKPEDCDKWFHNVAIQSEQAIRMVVGVMNIFARHGDSYTLRPNKLESIKWDKKCTLPRTLGTATFNIERTVQPTLWADGQRGADGKWVIYTNLEVQPPWAPMYGKTVMAGKSRPLVREMKWFKWIEELVMHEKVSPRLQLLSLFMSGAFTNIIDPSAHVAGIIDPIERASVAAATYDLPVTLRFSENGDRYKWLLMHSEQQEAALQKLKTTAEKEALRATQAMCIFEWGSEPTRRDTAVKMNTRDKKEELHYLGHAAGIQVRGGPLMQKIFIKDPVTKKPVRCVEFNTNIDWVFLRLDLQGPCFSCFGLTPEDTDAWPVLELLLRSSASLLQLGLIPEPCNPSRKKHVDSPKMTDLMYKEYLGKKKEAAEHKKAWDALLEQFAALHVGVPVETAKARGRFCLPLDASGNPTTPEGVEALTNFNVLLCSYARATLFAAGNWAATPPRVDLVQTITRGGWPISKASVLFLENIMCTQSKKTRGGVKLPDDIVLLNSLIGEESSNGAVFAGFTDLTHQFFVLGMDRDGKSMYFSESSLKTMLESEPMLPITLDDTDPLFNQEFWTLCEEDGSAARDMILERYKDKKNHPFCKRPPIVGVGSDFFLIYAIPRVAFLDDKTVRANLDRYQTSKIPLRYRPAQQQRPVTAKRQIDNVTVTAEPESVPVESVPKRPKIEEIEDDAMEVDALPPSEQQQAEPVPASLPFGDDYEENIL